MGYETKDWKGLEENEDDTLVKKYFNRLYFTMISFSSIGYGDITPKTLSLKIITCILAIIVIGEIITFVFDLKWRDNAEISSR